MASKDQEGTFAERVARKAWLTVVMLGACLLTMALSYHGAVWYLRESEAAASLELPPAVEAEELDGFSRELAALMRTYLDRVAREGSPPSQAFLSWASDSYCPRVNDLRRRIQASAATGEALNALLNASDKVYAMARDPSQAGLRQVAMEDVLEAGAAVETQLAALRHAGLTEEAATR